MENGSVRYQEIFGVLDQLEYRAVRTSEDQLIVRNLRTKAYMANPIMRNPNHALAVDEQDSDPSVFKFLVFFAGDPVATLRIKHVTKDSPKSTATKFFGNFLLPLLQQGVTFIDPTRLAVDPDASRFIPALPLLVMRLGYIAQNWFDADYTVAMVGESHAAFYRRSFRSTLLSGPLKTDVYIPDLVLLGAPKDNLPDIQQRYPLFNYTETEQRLLFGQTDMARVPLCVKPTARIALNRSAA